MPPPAIPACRHARAVARRLVLAACVLVGAGVPLASAQVGPVYPDDSPSAGEGLRRAVELADAGNYAEAARVIQAILATEGERVIESTGDPDLFISVRSRAHDILLSSPRLLEHYRTTEERAAQRALEGDGESPVERTRLLTRAGLEAALRVAQEKLEAGRFEAARMTLEQLERHPDRVTPRPGDERGAKDAAALALRLARFLPRDPVRAWAERWAAEAGLPGVSGQPPRAGAPVTLPRPAPPTSPLSTIPALDTTELTDRPLQSAWLSVEAEQEAELIRSQDRRSRLSLANDDSWTFPTVAGDAVYTNDGRCVAAWDRFTLQPIWKLVTRPVSDDDAAGPVPSLVPGRAPINRRPVTRNNIPGVEDVDAVVVAGPVVVACTGLTGRDGREGDGRVHAVDAATGRPLWSVSPGIEEPALAQAYVRGTLTTDADTVITPLRKPSRNQRVAGAYLAGIDLWTGDLRWYRLLGSAGWVYPRGQRPGDIPVVHEGVVYATDDLGVIAAVRADDGSPVWVRRTRSEGAVRIDSSAPAWSGGGPVVDGESIIAVSPARSQVLRLSRADGSVLGSRPAPDLGEPTYLVPVGEWLACVSADPTSPVITIVPRAGLESAPVRRVALARDVRIRGRAVAAVTPAGPRLLVPVTEGAVLVDPSHPDTPYRVALESSGNVVAMDSHLIVADRGKLHSYLAWSVAEKLLRARMDADPADARPALTYASLAHRSGHAEVVPFAADRAIAAAARLGDAPGAETRRSLFGVLLSMVQTTQEGWDTDADRREPRPGVRPAPVIADLAVLDAIVERLGRLADSTPERVQHLMALGRLRDAQALATAGPGALQAASRSLDAYQQLLEDTDLAGATWQGPGTATRTDTEAARRVRDLVRRYGRPVGRAFDARAQAEFAALLAENADAERFEALARRYPAAPVSVDAWLQSADAHERASRAAQALGALSSGLAAAEWAASVGDPAAPQIGEFAGRLVRLMQRRDQPAAAAQLLERVTREHPGVRLTVRSVELDAGTVAGELRRALAGLDRRPRLGRTFSGEVQALEGWAVMRPLLQDSRTHATEHLMLVSPERREVALFGAPGTGPLVPLWHRPFRALPPQLVAIDSESVLLFWASDEGGELERISAVGGATAWKTPQFGELFPAVEPETLRAKAINTPVEGVKRAHDLKIALDDQTIVLATHAGRIAAFDRQSGRTLWHQAGVITAVYDIDIGVGVGAGVAQATLLVAGTAERLGAPGEAPGAEPGLAAYDARSGRLLHHMKTTGGEPRWVRAGPGGEIVLGAETKISSLNLAAPKPLWELADNLAAHTSSAWVFGDRLIVTEPASGRRMWVASLSGGTRRDEMLDPGPGFDERSTRALVFGDPRSAPIAFCSTRGVAVFDADGRLVGRDPWDGKLDVLTPEPGEGVFVTIESARSGTDTGPVSRVHLLDALTGRSLVARGVVLHDEPRELALLDGRVVIGTEAVTIVLNLPAGQ